MNKKILVMSDPNLIDSLNRLATAFTKTELSYVHIIECKPEEDSLTFTAACCFDGDFTQDVDDIIIGSGLRVLHDRKASAATEAQINYYNIS